jgi:hypothetical protein
MDNTLAWLVLCHLGFHVSMDKPYQGIVILMGSTDGTHAPRDLTSMEILQVKKSIRICKGAMKEFF